MDSNNRRDQRGVTSRVEPDSPLKADVLSRFGVGLTALYPDPTKERVPEPLNLQVEGLYALERPQGGRC